MIEIGITGKTNSGKSSFFKAATMVDVEISDRTFVTIKPNVGVAYVTIDCVDKAFGVKCMPKSGFCRDGKRFVPVQLLDIAGLVPDAHLGKGLGLQFLDDIRQAPALIHVVDFSGLTNSWGKPTEGHDPANDIMFVENEIEMWFQNVIKRNLEKFKGKLPSTNSELTNLLHELLSGLQATKEQIAQSLQKFPISDVENFASTLRKLSKPVIIAANKIDLHSSQKNFERLKGNYPGMVPTSADSEIALKSADKTGLINYHVGNGFDVVGNLTEKQAKALDIIKKEVVDKFGSTCIQECLNDAVFKVLNCIAVYPVADANKLSDTFGNVLPDVFLVPNGTTLKEFAFKIHTDIGERFIGGLDTSTRRKLSADYVLKNNDVVEILFRR